jgi:hypothetical protein
MDGPSGAGPAGRPSAGSRHTERRSRRRIVSRHFLRRRARAAERHAQQAHPGASESRFVVEPAPRGPFRWYVVERR